jgi:hypothetical protein
MRIVIDNQNASHNGFSRRDYAFNETPEISCTAVEMTANQCVILISASMQRTVCPQRCIATIVQLIGLAQPGREAHLGLIIGRTDGCRSSKEPTRPAFRLGDVCAWSCAYPAICCIVRETSHSVEARFGSWPMHFGRPLTSATTAKASHCTLACIAALPGLPRCRHVRVFVLPTRRAEPTLWVGYRAYALVAPETGDFLVRRLPWTRFLVPPTDLCLR